MVRKSVTSHSARVTTPNRHAGSVTLTVDRQMVQLHKTGPVPFSPGILNVLLDGAALAQVSIAKPSATLVFTLPPHSLPATIDLVDPATGRSALDAPIAVDAALSLQIERAEIEKAQLIVTVSMAGHPVEQLSAFLVDDQDIICASGMLAPAAKPAGGRQRYSARLPLLRLLPIEQDKPLSLYLGGRRIAEPVVATAMAVGTVGFVDYAGGEEIHGWAADLKEPGRPVRLDILIGGRLVSTVSANKPRPDLAVRGVGTRCGFTVDRTILGEAGHGDIISVVLAGTQTHLINSPQRAQDAHDIRGLFDDIDGNQACGWVIDLSRPEEPCVVEAVCDGRVIGTALANGLRRDVLEAGFHTDRCGFRIVLNTPLHDLFGRDIWVRIKGSGVILNGGPHQPKINPNIRSYLTPERGIPPNVLGRLRARMNRQATGLGISIVMPVYNTRPEWLTEAVRSVCTQWCGAWELICVDDASTAPHVAAMLAWFAQTDSRIRVLRLPHNEGVAGATTRGIHAARYPYVALMDHDDVLEPDAVHHLIATARRSGADLIYSDEVLTAEDSAVVLDVRARPAFSHDYYLSHPYFVHMVAVRTEIAQRIGGFDARLSISADVDFILRVIEESKTVAHVPRVLYRWRTHAGSTGHDRQGQVMAATTDAIQRHLVRLGTRATAAAAEEFNQFEIAWPDPGGRVLIVIPTKDGIDVLRQCVDSIEATTASSEYRLVVIDHESKEAKSKKYLAQLSKRHVVMPHKGPFNYALMNNLAVRTCGQGEPFVLFMNNDIEAVRPGWLQRMRSLAAREDVGAVGTALMYSDRRIQHGGVIVGINGLADHALRFEPVWQQDGSRNLGYNASLTSVRDFSAVTAACMMMRRSVFDEVGGFNENYLVGFNDTDLCLRIGQAGYKLLYDGRTVLFHHESVTRIAKAQIKHPRDDSNFRRDWKALLAAGDPYYSPLLELYGADHKLRLGPCHNQAPRLVQVRLGKPIRGRERSGTASAGKPSSARNVVATAD